MTDPHHATDPEARADRLAALEADNARLRRLLDANGAAAGLRHAFRDTMTMLRAIVRRSAEAAGDADEAVRDYAAHLESRFDALLRVRAKLDAFGEADLHGLVADEQTVFLVREGERATIDGPVVRLQARAAQTLALAVHELSTNAVEHGSIDRGGRLTVAWRIEAGETAPTLVLDWTEAGETGPAGPGRSGFGTVVLTEMLPYDLGGEARLTREPDGLRYRARIPLTARVGRSVEGASAAGHPVADG